MSKIRLKYVGDGRYLLGVPARDLTEDDLAELAMTAEMLVATGLYVLADEGKRREHERHQPED